MFLSISWIASCFVLWFIHAQLSSAFKIIYTVSRDCSTNILTDMLWEWKLCLLSVHAKKLRSYNLFTDILMLYSRGKSALVFCSTRKGAQEAAQRLAQSAMALGHSNPFIKDREQQERLREASLSCSDKQMQSYILYGGIRKIIFLYSTLRKYVLML